MRFKRETLPSHAVKLATMLFVGFFLAPNISAIADSRGNTKLKKYRYTRQVKKPLYMQSSDLSFEFEVNSSVICADCHESHLGTARVYQTILTSAKHEIGASYFAQNRSVKHLRAFPNVYLENGTIACRSCHDGYTEELINDKRHVLQRGSKGMRDCSACHAF